MSWGPTLFIAGAGWTLALLVLTAVRFIRRAPPLQGVWPWPVWIAIASPFAAALLPLHALLAFVGVTRLERPWLAGLVFGPLLLVSVAGVFGLLKGAPK